MRVRLSSKLFHFCILKKWTVRVRLSTKLSYSCIFFLNSVPFYFSLLVMQGGFALIEAGCVRSKNTTNILIKNLLDSCKFYCLLLYTYMCTYIRTCVRTYVHVYTLNTYAYFIDPDPALTKW